MILQCTNLNVKSFFFLRKEKKRYTIDATKYDTGTTQASASCLNKLHLFLSKIQIYFKYQIKNFSWYRYQNSQKFRIGTSPIFELSAKRKGKILPLFVQFTLLIGNYESSNFACESFLIF